MPVELLVGAAVGAAAASPKARNVVRKGMVYGVAGVLMVYDKIASVTHGLVKGGARGWRSRVRPLPPRTLHRQARPRMPRRPNRRIPRFV